MLCVALADRLKMLPSEFRQRATKWDIIQLTALDRTRDEKWRQRQDIENQIEKSRTMSDAEKAARLFGG